MNKRTPRDPVYDTDLLLQDMHLKGWLPIDLARKAKVSHPTVGRFLQGKKQSARMAKKFADALGTSVRRYLVVPKPRKRPPAASGEQAAAV